MSSTQAADAAAHPQPAQLQSSRPPQRHQLKLNPKPSSRSGSPAMTLHRLIDADALAAADQHHEDQPRGGEDTEELEHLVPRPKLRIKPSFSREKVLGAGSGEGPDHPRPTPPRSRPVLPPYLKKELSRNSAEPGSPSEMMSPISCVLHNERLKRMHFKLHQLEEDGAGESAMSGGPQGLGLAHHRKPLQIGEVGRRLRAASNSSPQHFVSSEPGSPA